MFEKLCILFLILALTSSCKKIDLKEDQISDTLATNFPMLPDPPKEEIAHAMVNDSSSKLKSGTISVQSIQIERLDSGSFISGFSRRYFFIITDENSTELKIGYMTQVFASLADIQARKYRILFSWGLSESDGKTKAVRVSNNMAEKAAEVMFTSMGGITLQRVIADTSGIILLPPLLFNVAAMIGSYGCSTQLLGSQTQLNLDVELSSNTVAIIEIVIPTDQQSYAGKYWFDVRGPGNLHVHRSYATIVGDQTIKVSLPFVPSSLSMEQKLLKNATWEEIGLYYAKDFSLSKEIAGISYLRTSLTLL